MGMVFNLGDWVKVPVVEMGSFEFIAGPVVYINDCLFVVKSAVGGFTVSFTWTEAARNRYAFKKIDVGEARKLLADRLGGRELVV